MNADTSAGQPGGRAGTTGAIVEYLLLNGAFVLILAASLFISAGCLDWTMAWVYIGVYVAGISAIGLILISTSPELIAERVRVKEDIKSWDKILTPLYSLLTIPVTLVIAGLDNRFGWTAQMPPVIAIAALVIWVLGQGFIIWAMASNPFFATYMRIQKDRGHIVVSGGPYQIVRHPGYAGMIAMAVATPLVLESLWALIPGGLATLVVVVRTALEDRTLMEELDGYGEYARQVRYRLLPGVW
jgi:protein-S-isoprenylcysteine O-methyltransferase Ste14